MTDLTPAVDVDQRQHEAVRIDVDDAVAVVVVDNPPVNALSDSVLAGLERAAHQIIESDIRAVVVTGTGTKAFIAGADLEEFKAALGRLDWLEHHAELTHRVFGMWESLSRPVVAAVQASAMGGGLELGLVCDLIVADPSARFGFPEVKLGLIPGAGGTQRLHRRIPVTVARELLLLGESINAETALRHGLINRVSQPGESLTEALVLATQLAALPGRAVRGVKSALVAATTFGLERGLAAEREAFFDTFSSRDAREGCDAFLAKRQPRFIHR